MDSGGKSQVNIPAGSEWRFEVDFSQELTIKVVSGVVEINGTELPNNFDLKFKGVKLSIFCYQDSIIEYYGTFSSEYVSDESVVPQYVALHFALQNFRNKAATNNNLNAPRVLVIGGKDSGKTTLSKVLVSYAVKMDSFPMVVNLDPQEGVYTMPGALSATVVNDVLDVEQGWGQSILSGASAFHPTQPAVTYYGYDHINSNPSYYRYNIQKLASVVDKRLENDEMVRQTGVIIDTPALTNKDSSLIEEIVEAFSVNLIIVLGNERLFIDLKKTFSEKIYESLDGQKQFFNVLKFSKSGGCVDKDDAFIRARQQSLIKQYFYGDRKQVLSPYTITSIDYSRLSVYRIVESNKVNTTSATDNSENLDASSVLPIGMDAEEKALLEELEQSKADAAVMSASTVKKEQEKEEVPISEAPAEPEAIVTDGELIEKLEPESSSLQNAVIAFVHADIDEPMTKVLDSGVLCFGYISDANDLKKKLSVLLPVQGNLPNKTIVFGGFRYVD
ncbi:cleavage polyadenylation factor subunit [Saccharomycopsis crataegensis]|uniref:Polynucleotide 5'-hydroxyl-kinase GRC3 n=1 Tax=Saccharomycopsis crataegensis TaxID=43959 RepID=A0AAV5QSU4_9ASCO|nr:cleavage polyadenylation factor subunit [Saccharomycopsis crataegensis]